MRDLAVDGGAASATGKMVRLSEAGIGAKGVIVDVSAKPDGEAHGVSSVELQQRLLEFGFVEGARIELIHEGAIRRDPIAVRLDDMRVALRRRDAHEVMVLLDPAG